MFVYIAESSFTLAYIGSTCSCSLASPVHGISWILTPVSRDAAPWRSGFIQRRQRWFRVRQQIRPRRQSPSLTHCFRVHGPATASSGSTGVQILSPIALLISLCRNEICETNINGEDRSQFGSPPLRVNSRKLRVNSRKIS